MVGHTDMTEEHKRKIGTSNKGKKRSLEERKRMSTSAKKRGLTGFLGKRKSKKTREKLSIIAIQQWRDGQFGRGNKSHSWKGGITPINKVIRTSVEYKLWRTAVFIRDNRTCIWCGSKNNIEADHIKPFCIFPELRFAIDNGRTLCHDCHRKTDTYGNVNY